VKEEIIEHIKQLEVTKNIEILLAVESGSRAWGCPSPDSDYDIRIIYKRSRSEYLEIDDKPDSIDYFHGALLDINGWDIKKVLKLIRKSNATPFEWAQSPIVYKERDGFKDKILDLCTYYFQARHTVNHYKGIAKNSMNSLLKDEIKLKKLFYVLRPLMAAHWIIERNEIPPMDIPSLLNIITDKSVANHIQQLLKIKDSANEDYVHKVEPIITDYISNQFEMIYSTQVEEHSDPPNSDRLNELFKDLIEN